MLIYSSSFICGQIEFHGWEGNCTLIFCAIPIYEMCPKYTPIYVHVCLIIFYQFFLKTLLWER